MKLRVLIVAVALTVLFLSTGILYAASGDLVVNGNLGVGTTPTEKAEIKGNLKVSGTVSSGDNTVTGNQTVNGNETVNGNLQTKGNLCVGDNCTNTLHVSGGVYGYCQRSTSSLVSPCAIVVPPMTCSNASGLFFCACPSGYTMFTIQTGGLYGLGSTYSCYKQ